MPQRNYKKKRAAYMEFFGITEEYISAVGDEVRGIQSTKRKQEFKYKNMYIDPRR